MMRTVLILAFALAFFVPASAKSHNNEINPALEQFVEGFVKEELVKMSPSVYASIGPSYGNFGFIIGETGVVVVDCGWMQQSSASAFEQLKQITDKPIVAQVYTHGHADHVSGCPDEIVELDIPVYAHENFRRYRDEQVSSRLPFIVRRGAIQMGPGLEDGAAGNVGTGIGPLRYGSLSYAKPTHLLKGGEKLRLGGVDIEFINAPSDLDDSLALWLPKESVMFVGDAIGGTGPYASTPREESGRHPEAFIQTLDEFLRYPIEAMVPGHGREVIGRGAVKEVIVNARDTIQFLLDEVVRGMNAGISREQIMADLKLPPHLENSADLKWHYHPMTWVARGMYTRLGGWMTDDPMELVSLTPKDESQHLVKAIGGVKTVLKKARQALKDGDNRWAAQLAMHVSRVQSSNKEAKRIQVDAMRNVAYRSISSSERYYLLAAAGQVDGSFPANKTSPLISTGELLASVPYRQLLEMIRPRVDVDKSKDVLLSINVLFKGEGGVTLTLRKGVLAISDRIEDEALPSLVLSRQQYIALLGRVVGGELSLQEALKSPNLQFNQEETVRQFFSYLY